VAGFNSGLRHMGTSHGMVIP